MSADDNRRMETFGKGKREFLISQFSSLDRTRDDVLCADEASLRFDRDGDGRVSFEEFKASILAAEGSNSAQSMDDSFVRISQAYDDLHYKRHDRASFASAERAYRAAWDELAAKVPATAVAPPPPKK